MHTQNDHQFHDLFAFCFGMQFCYFAFFISFCIIFLQRRRYILWSRKSTKPNILITSFSIQFGLVRPFILFYVSFFSSFTSSKSLFFSFFFFFWLHFHYECEWFCVWQNELISSSRFISSIKVYWSLPKVLSLDDRQTLLHLFCVLHRL